MNTLDDIAARVARMERMCADLANVLGGATDRALCPMHEPGDPDCSPTHGGACRPPERTFTLEQARWVKEGDTIQAAHGEPEWVPVVSAVHTAEQTGLVTLTADGTTRLRWWAPRDLVKVATAPVPDPTPYRAAR